MGRQLATITTPGQNERSPKDPKAPNRRRVDAILTCRTGELSMRKAAKDLALSEVRTGFQGAVTRLPLH